MEEQEITAEAFVGVVEVGDLITLTIQEYFIKRHFDDYTDHVKSTWGERECWVEDPICMRCELNTHFTEKIRICEWITKSGGCNLRKRKVTGEELILREPRKDAKKLPLKLKFGKKEYLLGTLTSQNKFSTTYQVTVTPEMLAETDELKLKVIPYNNGSVKVGLLAIQGCDGQGRHNHRIHADTSHSNIASEIFHSFRVSLTIKSKIK